MSMKPTVITLIIRLSIGAGIGCPFAAAAMHCSWQWGCVSQIIRETLVWCPLLLCWLWSWQAHPVTPSLRLLGWLIKEEEGLSLLCWG